MRLGEFILSHLDAILVEWDSFAREIWPQSDASEATPGALRDHAAEILRAAARDMDTAQSPAQQQEKSEGAGATSETSDILDRASLVHARGRANSGFNLPEVIAEYRALRATVIRLWTATRPSPDHRDLADLTRFNEAIDQSLAEAVRGYIGKVEEARRMFLAVLGHDLRNPLSAVILSAEALCATPTLDADSKASAARIASSGKAMGRMLADFLDFTHSQLGKAMPVFPAPADLAPLCREVAAEFKDSHPDRSIRVTTRGDLRGIWDCERIRQLVSNLVGNAIQHGDPRPIDLIAQENGGNVELIVRNEGRQIPEDFRSRLFEPMLRGADPHRRKGRPVGSMGLGLHIAREVATAHHGTIEVESTPAGVTTFTVRLPRHPPPSSS